MAFDRKATAATTTAATATTAVNKKGSKDTSLVWFNFAITIQTKKGLKKTSAGISLDALCKKLFGDDWEEEIASLSEEELQNMAQKLEIVDPTINVVAPPEKSSYKDLF